jgi:integrase
MVASYQKYAVLSGIRWNPPKYEVNRKLPFIPLEREIDELIASCGKKLSTVLQLLKETGMRIGEALRLDWNDVDFEKRTVVLNNPEKHGNPRTFKISEKLISMLNRLSRDNSKVFGTSWRTTINNFNAQRKRSAKKLGNPRLLRIHFHTLRHWKATMEYHRTKDILYVMKLLGHKNIANTLVYTQLVEFEGDEYCSAVARSVEEAQKLVEAGFEYVCSHDETMLFRKRK